MRISLRQFDRRYFISAACAALLIICVGAVILLKKSGGLREPTDPLSALNSRNFPAERARFKKSIKEVGTESAYNLFKKETTGKEFGVAHTLSHIMGELVYEKEGLQGVVFCDAAFAFGCYHSFFGRAIADHGIGVVQRLDGMCIEKFGPKGLGCQHGIGHGVLGYLGDDELEEALDVCGKLSWKEPFGGCQSGVFMEFNFHTMQSLEGAESRPFNPEEPFYPCNSVDKVFSRACYFELPAWLLTLNGHNFRSAGEICEKAPAGDEREACYKGLGNSVGNSANYDDLRAIELCELMPNRRAELLCRAGAAWSFFAEPTSRNRKDLPCFGLTQSETDYCLKQAEIII